MVYSNIILIFVQVEGNGGGRQLVMLPLYLSATLAQSQSTLFTSLSIFVMMCRTVSFRALSSTVAPVCDYVVLEDAQGRKKHIMAEEFHRIRVQ